MWRSWLQGYRRVLRFPSHWICAGVVQWRRRGRSHGAVVEAGADANGGSRPWRRRKEGREARHRQAILTASLRAAERKGGGDGAVVARGERRSSRGVWEGSGSREEVAVGRSVMSEGERISQE